MNDEFEPIYKHSARKYDVIYVDQPMSQSEMVSSDDKQPIYGGNHHQRNSSITAFHVDQDAENVDGEYEEHIKLDAQVLQDRRESYPEMPISKEFTESE